MHATERERRIVFACVRSTELPVTYSTARSDKRRRERDNGTERGRECVIDAYWGESEMKDEQSVRVAQARKQEWIDSDLEYFRQSEANLQ